MDIGGCDIIIEHNKTLQLNQVFSIIKESWPEAVSEFDEIPNEMFVYKNPNTKTEWDKDCSNQDMIYVINHPGCLTMVINSHQSEEHNICGLVKEKLKLEH